MLSEIQRLKEEANRYLSLLSQEEDCETNDDLLSPGKKQSLTKEVESLQVFIFSAFNTEPHQETISYGRIKSQKLTSSLEISILACCGNADQ